MLCVFKWSLKPTRNLRKAYKQRRQRWFACHHGNDDQGRKNTWKLGIFGNCDNWANLGLGGRFDRHRPFRPRTLYGRFGKRRSLQLPPINCRRSHPWTPLRFALIPKTGAANCKCDWTFCIMGFALIPKTGAANSATTTLAHAACFALIPKTGAANLVGVSP